MAEESKLNADFSFTVNVAGIKAAVGGGPLHEGYYKGVVQEVGTLANKPNRIALKLKIVSEGAQGAVRTGFINVPKSKEDNSSTFFRAALESAGYTPNELDKGEIKLTASAFKGREMVFHFVPENPEAGYQYENLNFLPPAEWAQRAASFVPGSGVQGVPYKKDRDAAGGGIAGMGGGAALGAGAGTLGASLGAGPQVLGGQQGQTADELRATLLGGAGMR